MTEKLYYKMFRVIPVKRCEQLTMIESVLWVLEPTPLLNRELGISAIEAVEELLSGWQCQGYNLRQLEDV